MTDKLKIIVCGAFSLSMLDKEVQLGKRYPAQRRIPIPVTLELAQSWIELYKRGSVELESAIGHADTATLFSEILNIPLTVNRVSIKLGASEKNTSLLIGQYNGPRLPEGATTLPEGASIDWWIV